ncbi:hypothetical protein TWF718_005289 [Orbilia javanica]|uniref:GED domain-containing protein n=1 Tax=Orbilia javanica TaxID=47235 RepID=A0AAN8MPQ9_9PEZI
MEQRRQREIAFFNTGQWKSLEKKQVGADELKAFLSRLLYQQIQAKVPELSKSINDMIMETREELEGLGDARDDAAEQRHYLTMLATSYQNQVTRCLEGNLGKLATKNRALRIRALTQNLNEEFAKIMKVEGHTRNFKNIFGVDRDIVHSIENEEDDELDSEGEDAEREYTEREAARRADANGEDAKGEDAKVQDAKREKDMYNWIRDSYKASRGPELKVLINPYVVVDLFREQAKGWRSIAKGHIVRVVDAVENFNSELFKIVVADETVRRRIKMKLAQDTSNKILVAYNQFEVVVAREFDGILQTVDEDFERVFNERKTRRISHLVRTTFCSGVAAATGVSEEVLQEFIKCFGGTESIVEEIHDVLMAYYPVALKRFVATVNFEVIEERLLGEEGPIRLFRPEYIAKLTDEELCDITREDMEVSERRRGLQIRLDLAEKALEAANSI